VDTEAQVVPAVTSWVRVQRDTSVVIDWPAAADPLRNNSPPPGTRIVTMLRALEVLPVKAAVPWPAETSARPAAATTMVARAHTGIRLGIVLCSPTLGRGHFMTSSIGGSATNHHR
jgi:hypothetical protein